MKLTLLINVLRPIFVGILSFVIIKMSTFVGILTLISMINTTSESLRARKVFIFHESLKFHAQLN